jgi:phosphohistidine swiveling domain-containing protein
MVTMTTRRIVALGAEARTSGAEVGFKAARLADAARLGLPVPEAFALSMGAFREFCRANGIRVSEGPPERLAEAIRAGAFPAALRDELRERLAALPGLTLAVRSSAPSEDGAACSMAGQLDTFLDVRREDVPEKVKACWAALFGPPVLAYAAKHGMAPANEMGVIVQRQIHPRYAGVVFTLDPVTGSADHFVIEWVEGLGDALVSGTVSPERIRVSRRRPVIPAGLAPDLARALAQLAAHAALVERQVGSPVDIEWCVEGTTLFLLQARPVTAAMARDAVVWTSTNMSENFPKPLTPFAWSIVDEFYTRYVRSLARMLGVRDAGLEKWSSPIHRLTGVQGGRVCYNIRSWYELLETYVPGGGGALRRGLDHYIGQRVPVPLDAGDRGTRARRAGPLAWLAFWSRLALHLSRGRRCLARFERLFLAYRRALRRPSYDSLAAPALMQRLDALFEDFVARHWHRQCIADFSVLVFPGLLDALLERWAAPSRGPAGTGALSARLLRQLRTSGTEAAAIIARMADGIGAHPDLAALLEARRHDELAYQLPAPLWNLYATFMERFGSRCYHECLIVSPTFEEQPGLFWDLVEKYRRAPRTAGRPQPGGPQETDAAAGVLRALPPGRRLVVRLVQGQARRAIALREQGRLVQSLLFGEVRRLALALGEKLVRLGHLRTAEDVFYLHTAELRDLCAGKFLFPETLPDLIALRRRALERCEEREPPECFVLPEGAYFRAIDPGASCAEGPTLRGVGASGGRARGTARVVLDPARDGFEPGDILVARSTDPGWTALFAIAGALVLERGGILSHGAIVAREFGVPAVVGVEGATRRLRGGERVSVDGDTGEVVILAAAEGAAPHADRRRPRAEDIRARTRDHQLA